MNGPMSDDTVVAAVGYDAAPVVALYTRRLQNFGEGPLAQGWASRASQRRRFAALAGVGNLRGATVLDVGCGLADLYAYLREKGALGSPGDYTGVDFAPTMVRRARARFPEVCFVHCDVAAPVPGPDDEALPDADYVLASGLFSYLDEGRMRATVARLYAHCRRGLAFNVLSTLAPDKAAVGTLLAADPNETFRFCRTLTPWVTLRHDYLPHDFTVYLHREH